MTSNFNLWDNPILKLEAIENSAGIKLLFVELEPAYRNMTNNTGMIKKDKYYGSFGSGINYDIKYEIELDIRLRKTFIHMIIINPITHIRIGEAEYSFYKDNRLCSATYYTLDEEHIMRRAENRIETNYGFKSIPFGFTSIDGLNYHAYMVTRGTDFTCTHDTAKNIETFNKIYQFESLKFMSFITTKEEQNTESCVCINFMQVHNELWLTNSVLNGDLVKRANKLRVALYTADGYFIRDIVFPIDQLSEYAEEQPCIGDVHNTYWDITVEGSKKLKEEIQKKL